MFIRMLLILFLCITSIKVEAMEKVGCVDAIQPASSNLKPRSNKFNYKKMFINPFVFPFINFYNIAGIIHRISFEVDEVSYTIKVRVKNPRKDDVSHQVLFERLLNGLDKMPKDLLKNIGSITVYNYDNNDIDIGIDKFKRKDSDISIPSYESGLYSFSYSPMMFESYLLRLIENYIQRNI